MTRDAPATSRRPLDGIRVLELGQLMAGPVAGTILSYFGAEVIKVEKPDGGDPVRSWRVLDDGTSLWWRHIGRNKKLVSIDLRTEEGRALVKDLALQVDVLIENFRPGTLERWGLAPETLREANPRLICARVSGFGQTGPYKDRRGFASVCEAIGGLRYVTGHPGETPVRSNLSLGDTIAAFHTAMGILLALLDRERGGEGHGQDVDIAIYEAVFACLEGAVTEYDRQGVVREPSGTTITGVVPTDAYMCADGRRVVIGANGDSIFQRLMRTAERPDMAEDPRYATNDRRVGEREAIDTAIEAWTQQHPSADVLGALDAAGVPAGLINNVADMFQDEHFQARGLFEETDVGGRPAKLPAIPPRLVDTPGRTEWAGADLGAHTDEVLGALLGLDAEALGRLRASGVIR
ncbi:MAG: CaiB/BaiF CoA-transferase family protein [Planctomycetota bacterium]|nr:CaiB/BaiF CoA-transferase family protein [Planctomycetota bacterium]